MEKYRAIPKGYMGVGEFAKKMNITVRTLQYYDKEGLLAPSAQSEGGRRLYTDKDLIKLHQILSLKHLGFSLDDIKNRLISLDTPVDVANMLTKQAADIQRQIESLSESLREIELLKTEILQMRTVDFKRYADIIVNLQMKNDHYWLIKHIDDQTLEQFRGRFDMDSGLEMVDKFNKLQDEAVRLQKEGVPPESEKGQLFAQALWSSIMEFTQGDMGMLPKLMELGDVDAPDEASRQKQALANAYIGPALDAYCAQAGIDLPEEEMK